MISKAEQIILKELYLFNGIRDGSSKGTELIVKYWQKSGKLTKFPEYFCAFNFYPDQNGLPYLLLIEKLLEELNRSFNLLLTSIDNCNGSEAVEGKTATDVTVVISTLEQLKDTKIDVEKNTIDKFYEYLSINIKSMNGCINDVIAYHNAQSKACIETNVKSLRDYFTNNNSYIKGILK